MEESESTKETINFFPPISADNEGDRTEVESLCVNCGDNGLTKFLLTKIPFYKELIISSFACQHCGFENNGVQIGGEILNYGVEYLLNVEEEVDLNRQIVKSDYAAVCVPELELEVPGMSQKGEITTVEGILQRVCMGLEQDQGRRKEEHPEDFEKVQAFMERVEECKSLKNGFHLKIRDISGHSFIAPPQSILPGQKDPRLQMTQFERTPEENHLIGYFPELQNNEQEDEAPARQIEDVTDEIHQFQTPCNSCGRNCMTRMKLTKIPHFKEVVIMATNCDHCGYRTNEVKSGGGIEPRGRKICLRVVNGDDLCRDVLKSETCSLEIPELDLHVGGGTLGGKFTTLEGLLNNIKDQLLGENPLISGDSADTDIKEKMKAFCQKLDQLISAQVPFTVVLDDPAGNSYLQNIYAPDDDPNMEIADYERTFEQNEELGLNDINVGDFAETAEGDAV